MESIRRKNGANTQYQFWIQDDGAIEISSEKFFHQKSITSTITSVRAQIVSKPEYYGWSSSCLYEKDDTKFLDALLKYSDEYFLFHWWWIRSSPKDSTERREENRDWILQLMKASGEKKWSKHPIPILDTRWWRHRNFQWKILSSKNQLPHHNPVASTDCFKTWILWMEFVLSLWKRRHKISRCSFWKYSDEYFCSIDEKFGRVQKTRPNGENVCPDSITSPFIFGWQF